MSKGQNWLDAANKRLKGVPVSLEMSGVANNLSIRGSLPAKPWEANQQRRQRKVSLGISAIEESDVKTAEQIARQIALDLNRGQFDWTQFPGIEDPRTPAPKTIGDWVQVLERDRRHRMQPDTWRYNYELLMTSLPVDMELTEDALIDWILEENSVGDTMRAKYVAIAAGLCELAGVSSKGIRSLKKDAPNKAVNPRDLPEDETIVSMWRSIADEEWAWVFAMLSTYGLRPHELFHLDLAPFPDIRILEDTKTGERLVPAIHPQWVKRFDLTQKIRIPSSLDWDPEMRNWRLGRKIGMGFTRHKLGHPYNLRHCYARRCLELGLTSDISAKLMGHSREVHERTYRAFIKNSVYVESAKRTIERAMQGYTVPSTML